MKIQVWKKENDFKKQKNADLIVESPLIYTLLNNTRINIYNDDAISLCLIPSKNT